MCLYSCLSYPACKSHLFCAVLYCHLWHFWLYHIFPRYLINGMIFEKKIFIEYKIIFSTTSVRNISHSKKYSASYYHKCTQVFMQSTRYSCQTLIKLEISRQILEKPSNIKFNENPSSGSRVVPRGRTDRRTDTTKLIVTFSQFCECA